MRCLTPCSIFLLTLAFLTGAALAAPPANDNFASRMPVNSGTFTVNGSNFEATKETGEPYHGGSFGGFSVWYTWTAPSTGVYTLQAKANSTRGPLLGVYTGTAVNALTQVASGPTGDPATFVATAGTVYQFALDSYFGTPFLFTLSLSGPIPLPTNDHFADRTDLGSAAASVTTSNFGCTKEAGEPNHAGEYGGRSVWFTWTAPASGACSLLISNYSIGSSPLLGVYTGAAVNALTLVSKGAGYAGFVVTAGTTYQFAVDSYNGIPMTFTLGIAHPMPLSANDNFANATVISKVPTIISGHNIGASLEPGEPYQYSSGSSGGRSIWFRWTAPASGECVFSPTENRSAAPMFAVYTGPAVNSLTKVVDTGFYYLSSFNAVAGTTYHIALDGSNGFQASFEVMLSQVYPKAANDDFASRTVLPATGAAAAGTVLGASKEVGEPSHARSGDYPGNRSLWWSWTPASSGEVTLTVNASKFSAMFCVYTGSSLNTLTKVVGGGALGYPSLLVNFDAVAGTTYQIALDDSQSVYAPPSNGDFSLQLSDPVPPPANDSFANRTALGGTYVKVQGSNRGASKEPGESNHWGSVGGKSVWYSWTAPTTATFNFYVQSSSSSFAVRPGIYTGTGVGTLTAVPPTTYLSNGSLLGFAFSATAGTTYHLAVDGYHNGQFATSGEFVLTISQPPANEAFANATNLGSAASGASSSWVDYSGGTESGEPGAMPYPSQQGPRSIWWRWTPPASGLFTFDTLGADFDTALHVYTGAAVSALTQVAENHDADIQGRSSLTLNAIAGTTYHIRVSGETPEVVGPVQLQWSQLGSPSTAADHVALGRALLQQQTNAGITSADAAFASALALDANHAEANFLKALTTFALLEQGTSFQNTLTALGIVDSEIYQGEYTLAKDAQGNYIAQPGATTTAVGINYLADTVLPALTVIRAHFAKAASPSFVTTISDTETGGRFLIFDAGDISLIQASLHGLEAVTRLLQTYNAGVNVGDVFTAANNDQLKVENIAKSFTNLLTFTGNDQRAAFKTALQSANAAYQAGSAFVRTTRDNKRDRRHIFYLRDSANRIEEEVRENLQATSNSLNGAAPIGNETVNLAQAITSPKSLREQLVGLVGNKGVGGTAPDPTFDGVVPNSSQGKVNRFLRRTGLLHEISNFSSWAAAFLGGQSAPDQAKSADPDKDMLSNFAEYAFNLDPGKASATQEYTVSALQTNTSDGKKYLNLSFVRRVERATIDYVVAVSDNLTTWDRTGTQLVQVGAATANADGVTETLTVRLLADPLVTSRKFVRLEVSELNP